MPEMIDAENSEDKEFDKFNPQIEGINLQELIREGQIKMPAMTGGLASLGELWLANYIAKYSSDAELNEENLGTLCALPASMFTMAREDLLDGNIDSAVLNIVARYHPPYCQAVALFADDIRRLEAVRTQAEATKMTREKLTAVGDFITEVIENPDIEVSKEAVLLARGVYETAAKMAGTKMAIQGGSGVSAKVEQSITDANGNVKRASLIIQNPGSPEVQNGSKPNDDWMDKADQIAERRTEDV